MATETELLIASIDLEWQSFFLLRSEMKYEEANCHFQKMQELQARLPKLYYIEGFGDGLAKRTHFAGTHESCVKWVSHNRNLVVLKNGRHIVRKEVEPIGIYPLAGAIWEITPELPERWQEISDMAELDKKLKEGDRRVGE